MWDSLRMNKGEGLLSWNLFYFGPTEDSSDISIECIAPVSSRRLRLSRWTQRAAELRRVGGCTPQSHPRTGMRVHQPLLLSCPLLPAHFPGRKAWVHPWQGLQHALFCSSAPPAWGSQPFCLAAVTQTLKYEMEKTCLSLLPAAQVVVEVRMGWWEVDSACGGHHSLWKPN